MIAGSAFLVTGQPERALETYREAFATGERAEIDLNLGRAYACSPAAATARDAALAARRLDQPGDPRVALAGGRADPLLRRDRRA